MSMNWLRLEPHATSFDHGPPRTLTAYRTGSRTVRHVGTRVARCVGLIPDCSCPTSRQTSAPSFGVEAFDADHFEISVQSHKRSL